MMPLSRLCVFCGSSSGSSPHYAAAASRFGRLLAARGIGLVYGGGSVGLMGAVADGALEAGGDVIGVIPEALMKREIGHAGVPDMRVVGSMHERKALMAELSDAFVALPGGIGTFEEFFEVWTWSQLGLHAKPCALLNVGGYYDGLLAFLEHATSERFLRPAHLGFLVVEDDPEALLARLPLVVVPSVPKWITADES
jgi:uncharacterized protein (TIGR00730 family)